MRKIDLCGAIVLAVIGLDSSTALAADALPAAAADTPAVEAPPARTGPLYGYVGRANQAALHQLTPAMAAQSGVHSAGLLPAVAEAVTASMIDNHGVAEGDANPAIQDPSEDLARAIAGGLADAKGGLLAKDPIARDQWRGPGKKDADRAAGARYVVEVAPVTMTLAYFALDWRHYDLMFNTTAQVIDTADGRVISKARCSISRDHSGPLAGRPELLANHAEKLNAVVAIKASACLARLEAGLDLPMRNRRPLTLATLASNPATSSALASGATAVALISDASPACNADKRRYAAEVGVPCEALSERVDFHPAPLQTVAKPAQAPAAQVAAAQPVEVQPLPAAAAQPAEALPAQAAVSQPAQPAGAQPVQTAGR
jgi:hypothetical protein